MMAAALSACASGARTRQSELTLESQGNFRAILTQPFTDFNLIRTEIPKSLASASADPYAEPAHPGCDGLAREIGELNAILGPDLKKADGASREPIISREAAERAAREAARSAASSWIPFRGFVRQLTGAERHARALREAILAGMVRRAYLKGFGNALGCAGD